MQASAFAATLTGIQSWIKLRETQDDADNEQAVDGAAGTTASGAAAAGREPEGPYVVVPTDVARRHEPCSICMENFRDTRHKETGQAVWMNVVKVGDKYYHLTCYNDVNKGGQDAAAGRRGTPEPLLGKRKFEA
jgi:pre-mRNA cleavage complex 2 protein Pcf11